MVKPGIYQHFKGGRYQVLGSAVHSENDEVMVVYFPLYGDQAWFVRPLEMFLEQVEYEGKWVPRFEWVCEAE